MKYNSLFFLPLVVIMLCAGGCKNVNEYSENSLGTVNGTTFISSEAKEYSLSTFETNQSSDNSVDSPMTSANTSVGTYAESNSDICDNDTAETIESELDYDPLYEINTFDVTNDLVNGIGKLLEKNMEFYEIFLFSQDYKLEEHEKGSIYSITFENYKSFNEFEASLYSTYSYEYAYNLLNNFNGNGKSFWKDDSGKTQVNIHVFGGGGINAFRYGKDSYTYHITSISEDKVCFDFSYRVWNEYGIPVEGIADGEDTIVTISCYAVKESDGWKLPYMVGFDNQ